MIFFALIIAGVSCKKNNSPAPEAAPKFMSVSAGSTWAYETTNTITATSSTNTVTSTNRDSTIYSKSYHIFTNTNGSGNTYYNITGNDYYTFASLAALNSGNVDILYLNDNAAVGASWSQVVPVTIPGIPLPVSVTLINTVTEKGITRTVNGKAYTAVIHTTTTFSVPGLPAGSLTTDIQSYYAPAVGLIESKNKISFPSAGINTDQTTILKTADIK